MMGLRLLDGRLDLATDLPVPTAPPGEAVVRVLKAGICNTDLELLRGYYPFAGILGHEFVGVVEAAPDGHEDALGQRVVGEINAICGACPACGAGRGSHCANRTVLGIVGRDGAFAEYLTLPIDNLHPVSDVIPDEVAVFTEPLAAALQIQEQVDIGAADRVLVVGDGKLGQLIARTLRLTGASICVAGRHRRKLDMLRRLDLETVEVSEDAAGLRGFDLAVECTGNNKGFALARDALRPCGTLVMKSTYADRLTVDASSLVVDEITLVGSRCGPFAPALKLLQEGVVEVHDLIDDTFPLAEGLAAFERAGRPGALKVLLRVS